MRFSDRGGVYFIQSDTILSVAPCESRRDCATLTDRNVIESKLS